LLLFGKHDLAWCFLFLGDGIRIPRFIGKVACITVYVEAWHLQFGLRLIGIFLILVSPHEAVS
jgi:hypothetical protein